MQGIGAPEIIVLLLVLSSAGLIKIFPYWKIFEKAGFSPLLSLLMVVPLVNILLLFYLGFGEWPALQDQQKL
ncbi:MAG TPA: hypothetical protein VK141_01175 [Nitrosomonas sp.]|nr:hypothetical protein [Nitrosomonas sp.]